MIIGDPATIMSPLLSNLNPNTLLAYAIYYVQDSFTKGYLIASYFGLRMGREPAAV